MGGGNKNTTSYHEEVIRRPDDVRIAEINAQSEITKKELEAKIIEIQKNAQIEITETNARTLLLLDEARNANMAKTVEVLYDFTKEINTLAQERISFLNHADLEQVKAINTHYDDLIRDINEEQKNYVLNTMPNLFEKANSFEKDSDAYKMYYSIIDQSSANFVESINKRIDNATKNQRMIIEYNNELKSMIIGQTQLLVQETMANAKNLFNTSNVFSQINKDIKSSLTYDKQEALPDKSKKE
ncbi:MAG: hypothetical protein RBS16_09590 [Candidatus Cloacimonadales bacterium]|jgi:hypothetical protein|nr:hypothetical protein [Candidatus Cloacimonadota bacterium]MDX9978265.1 hypothetical protein [Candidatus Cloacimonadales bacterium]